MTNFFDEEHNYEVIMQEKQYYNALQDFLNAGCSQGYYNALSEVIELCPVYERPMLFKAIEQIAKELK